MRTNSPKIHAILTLFVICLTRDTNCEKIPEVSRDKISESTNESLPIGVTKNVNKQCKGKKCFTYWMAIMGSIQPDLMNSQALIVKDEDVKGVCDKADRKSEKRYLLCASSILNRNHVLTSASCMHIATHIRHNIRGTLSVAIAPLKSSMQVIRVSEYKINPAHNTNPYSMGHLTHNLAILKLACRIDMENFHKIDLPRAPFVHTCSEENCVVPIYRRIKRTRWVMFQLLAPHVPLPNRRRKETTIKDEELRKIPEYKNNETTSYGNNRAKRKLAEPPIFMSQYESRRKSENIADDALSNLTGILTTENSQIELTTRIISEARNMSIVTPRNLKDDGYEDWLRPIGNETIRSFVVRSSDVYRYCTLPGAAVMSNRTQSAVVAVPCDDRQPSAKWGYTDVYNNLDWIHDILQDWNAHGNGSSGSGHRTGSISEGMVPKNGPGNFSSCSTCIFNFFIEIGCKDKNQCGNRSTSASMKKIQERREPAISVDPSKSKSQGCSDSNSVGIEIAFGQGCDKSDGKLNNKPEYRGNWAKSLNSQIPGSLKGKNLPDGTSEDGTLKLEQPVTADPVKTTLVKDQRDDKGKYSRKDGSRISENPRRNLGRSSSIFRAYKTPKVGNKNRDRVSNEIGLHNIEGDSTDWLSEVEKGLEINSEVKRESVESPRVHRK